MKHIYVSPHSDDVALSCGGQILSDPTGIKDIMILNIFTSDLRDLENKEVQSDQSLFDSLNADRSSEDRAAWDSIGVETHYANLPEALLRKRFPFELFGSKRDVKLDNSLDEVLKFYLVKFPDAVFHFPAGFGNHIDHLACRDAAFRLLDNGTVGSVLFYEDVPYSWLTFIRNLYYKRLLRHVRLRSGTGQTKRHDGQGFWSYLTQRSVPFPRGKKLFLLVFIALGLGRLRETLRGGTKKYSGAITTVDLSEAVLEKKRSLLSIYESQIPMLFGDQPTLTLRNRNDSFSKEISIEVSNKQLAENRRS